MLKLRIMSMYLRKNISSKQCFILSLLFNICFWKRQCQKGRVYEIYSWEKELLSLSCLDLWTCISDHCNSSGDGVSHCLLFPPMKHLVTSFLTWDKILTPQAEMWLQLYTSNKQLYHYVVLPASLNATKGRACEVHLPWREARNPWAPFTDITL